ncbi:MAG TPA: rod shape-determining protein MreC [Coriobacteriia bacterium]|nr:rod shape-determining protein MreC [Coriobacteriia bacterium]
MTLWVREGTTGPLHTLRSGVETVTAPVKNVGAVIGAPFRAVGDLITGVSTSTSTVEELRIQNEKLASELIRMEEYRQENERLSALLGLKDAYGLESVGARVIMKGADAWNRVITINKGTASGFTVGMPVLSANGGLIGQIESVSYDSSVVRLITDEKSGVAAFIQSNRTEGIWAGSVDGVLHLEFIAGDVEVKVGDPIITSGSGGVFPKGLAIGEVASIEFAPADVYKTIVVRPISRAGTYEEVLVITGSEAEIVAAQNTGTTTDTAGDASSAEAQQPEGTTGG